MDDEQDEVADGTQGGEARQGEPHPPWYALHVRSQFERKVRDALLRAGLEVYLPSYTEHSRWTDRTVPIERMLFPGYVFSQFWWRDRRKALDAAGVVRILGAVPEAEIEGVRTLLAAGLPVQVLVAWRPPVAGEKVRIEHGPFAGVEGVVTRLKGKQHVVVSIELLQRSVAAELEAAAVRVLPRQMRKAA